MKLFVTKGTTSKTMLIFIPDSSSSTGAGLTGLAYNSSGLAWYYYREGQGTGGTSVTLATMTLGTWATGGFVEVDSTNMPGFYEIGVPNAALATGVDFVGMQLKGATNMAPVNIEIQLTNLNVNDGVRAGLTALPNAAADAAGGLAISDAGGLDLDTLNSNVSAVKTKTDSLTFTQSGHVDANVLMVSNDSAAADNLEADYDGAGYAKSASSIATVTTVGTVTTLSGHTPQTGDSYARIGANGAGLTAVPWNASWDAEVQSEVNDGLVALGLDHLVSASVAGTDITDDSIVAQLVSASATADWDDFDNTTDSMQAIRDRGDAAWTTGAGGSDRLLMVDTTIATLSSQTSFTLTAGSADDDAYNNCTIVIEDASTATQKAVGMVSDYAGSTKTVTLKYDPGIFTMATSDKVYILAENSLKSTAQNRQLDVTATGAAGIDWGNVENQSTAVDLSATDIQLCDTITTYTGNTVQTGDAFARLGAPAGASVSADIATVVTQIGTAGDGLSNIPWNASWDTEVQSECNDALVALNLDHVAAASVSGTDIVDNSIVAKLVSASATADWDDYVNTTDSLQAIRDRGDSAWPTATGFSTHSAADVRTEMDSNSTQLSAIVADTNELQTDWANGGRLDLILDSAAVKTGYSLSSSGLDSIVIETGVNARQAISVIASAAVGVLAGAATTTVTIAAAENSGTNRITATVDADGNRDSVTLSLPS